MQHAGELEEERCVDVQQAREWYEERHGHMQHMAEKRKLHDDDHCGQVESDDLMGNWEMIVKKVAQRRLAGSMMNASTNVGLSAQGQKLTVRNLA